MPIPETTWVEQPMDTGDVVYHLYEDESIMLYENGDRMLIRPAGSAWTEQPPVATTWTET